MSRTRASIGKIASLSHAVREELNSRLHDGESSRTLLPWLNEHPRVKPILSSLFGGREINEQNLSHWRLKGFKARQKTQHRVESAQVTQEEAAAVHESSGADDVTARVAIHACLTLDKLLTTLSGSGNLEDRATQSTVLSVVREIIQLRRLEVDAQKTRFQMLKWTARQSQSPVSNPSSQNTPNGAHPPSPPSTTPAEAAVVPDLDFETGHSPEEASLARTLYASLKSSLAGASGHSAVGLDQAQSRPIKGNQAIPAQK